MCGAMDRHRGAGAAIGQPGLDRPPDRERESLLRHFGAAGVGQRRGRKTRQRTRGWPAKRSNLKCTQKCTQIGFLAILGKNQSVESARSDCAAGVFGGAG